MNWSTFVQKIPFNNGVILRNYRNDSIITLTNSEFNEVEFFLKDENFKLNNNLFSFLREHNFLVSSLESEKKEYLEALLEDIDRDDFLCIHYVPTSRCNFICPYCYQQGIDKQEDLTFYEIDSFCDFLSDYINHNKIQTINFVLHGGEPTVGWKNIEYILPKVSDFCKEHEICFYTQIVTNGYLLTLDKVRYLQKFNLRRIQVTLDGDKEIHDKRRILENGNGTYDVIINNLKAILDNEVIDTISLRINIDKSNYNNIKEFIPKISSYFPPSKIRLSLGFITGTITNNSDNYFSKKGFSNLEFVEKYLELYRISIHNSFTMPDAYTISSFCTAKMKHSFIFTPNGFFYKCLSFVGRKNFSIGTLDSISDEAIQKNNFINQYKKCLEKGCFMFPLCKSSCKFESFLSTSDIDKTYCNKKLYE